MVKSFINDKSISTLVDSGAESNIIDAELLKELKSVNRNIKLRNKPVKFICANGFSMTQKMTMNFKVVENVFPKIIIGNKSMKSNRIVPKENCIYVQNKRANFVSKTRVSETKN